MSGTGRTNKMTTRDLTILRHYAYNKGIKSIYYVRTYTDDGTDILPMIVNLALFNKCKINIIMKIEITRLEGS